MIFNTKGIVLSQIKLNDTRIIVNVYTEQFGRMAYMFIYSKKNKYMRNILRPFYVVEIEAKHKSNRGVHSIIDLKLVDVFSSIPFDIYKSTQALFLSEILAKVLVEEEKNEDLFTFIINSANLLDLQEDNVTLFYLFFLARLTKYLGFIPIMNHSAINRYFDLEKGEFTSTNHNSNKYLDDYLSEKLFRIFTASSDKFESMIIDQPTRILLTSAMLNYYSLHISGFKSLKSLKVLNELFL